MIRGFVCKTILFFFFALFGVLTNYSQNVFDGTAVILDAPLTGGLPASRYSNADHILVKNLSNTSNLTACGNGIGSPTDYPSPPLGSTAPSWDGTNWKVPRNINTGYWCFKSAYTSHQLTWDVIEYKWLPNSTSLGFYNVKDFGALGNSTDDDTLAIKNTLIYASSKNGGTVYFPKGIYKVTSAITLPPGILIQGSMGKPTSWYAPGANSESSSQILLAGTTSPRSIFRIGENVENVRIKDIELKAISNSNTYGVEGVGNFAANSAARMISFVNVVFSNFDIGIYVHNGNTGQEWQFDFVKVDSCFFSYNRTAGIQIDTYNSDWNISNSFFAQPNKVAGVAADAIYINRAGGVVIESTFSGGGDYATGQIGGDFVEVNGITSLAIIGSASERAARSIVFAETASVGSRSSLISVSSSVFGDPIELYKAVNYISNGNRYAGQTVKAFTSGVKIYSFGDRFCYDIAFANPDNPNPCGVPLPLPIGQTIGFQGNGTIMFQTGQAKEGPSQYNGQIIPAIPATVGTDTVIKSDSNSDETKPILKLIATNVPGQGKTFLEMGQDPFFYRLSRNKDNGFLSFEGTQSTPYKGYIFDSPIKLPSKQLSGILLEAVATVNAGSMLYCTDCLKGSSPCSSGGAGALAISNGSQWDCK